MLDLLRKKEKTPPESQLKRTYQNDLRAIGRHADDLGLRHLGVYEVPAGYIMRAFSKADPDAIEAIELPESDVRELIVKNFTARGHEPDAIRRPLCPTGYEDFFRALGYELEKAQAKAVAIQEYVTCFAVSYQQLRTTLEGYAWEPQEWIVQAVEAQKLLDSGFRRRGKSRD